MSERATIVLNVNGAAFDTSAVAYDTLLTVIRDQLFLTGTKRGCNQGVCGACTVLSDSRPVRSCLSLALDCEDKRIDTIEGLCDHPLMQALQRCFHRRRRLPMRILHARHAGRGVRLAYEQSAPFRSRHPPRHCLEICAAAPATKRSSRRCSAQRTHCRMGTA